MEVFDTSPVSAFGLLKRTNTKEFADSLQAETNLWHLHSTTSQAFYKPGMQPGRKKQWLKRVTGSAVISLSWENARDFSSFVRSIQEVISFPINYLPCRKKRKKKKISYLQHEQLSLLSFQNYQNRQCGEASYTVMCVPSHFFDKEQWLPHNSRVSSEVGGNNDYPKTCSLMWQILFSQAKSFGASLLKIFRACNRDLIRR